MIYDFNVGMLIAMIEIPGYNGKYFIDENSNVYSSITKKYLSKNKDGSGYFMVKIGSSNKKVHRLMAITFLKKPRSKSQVNHKDGNKENNHINNLEWVTPSENVRHYLNLNRKNNFKYIYEIDLKLVKKLYESGISQAKIARKIKCSKYSLNDLLVSIYTESQRKYFYRLSKRKSSILIYKNSKLIKEYQFIKDASNDLNISISSIQRMLNGVKENHKGYTAIWKK